MKGLSGIILLLAVTTAHGGPVRGTGRIVGGFEIAQQLVPYQVSLEYQNSHICGGSIPPKFRRQVAYYIIFFSPPKGSIIAPKWVLTATHCTWDARKVIASLLTFSTSTGTYGLPSAYFAIRAGSAILQSGGDVIKVAKIIQHSDFDRITYDFDFCLLQLATKIVLDGTTKAPIPLPEADTPIPFNTPLLVSGWGYTLTSQSRNKLRAVVVTTDNHEECDQKYYYDGGVSAQMVCASDVGKDSCNVRTSLKPSDIFEWLHWIYLQGDSGEMW